MHDCESSGHRVMHSLGPNLGLECFEEVVFVRARELHFRLAKVALAERIFEEEVIDADFLAFREGIHLGQDASVLVEVTCFDLHDFPLNHTGQYFLNSLAKLLRLSLAALRSVYAVDPEDKSRGSGVEEDDCLEGVAICDFGHLGEEGFIVEREIRCVLDCHKAIVLLVGERLQLRESDAFRQEGPLGSVHHLLFVKQHGRALSPLLLLLVVGSRT